MSVDAMNFAILLETLMTLMKVVQTMFHLTFSQ
jgi:hypothetical protein